MGRAAWGRLVVTETKEAVSESVTAFPAPFHAQKVPFPFQVTIKHMYMYIYRYYMPIYIIMLM